MRKAQAPGVKHLPREGTAFPVNRITEHGMPEVREMHANLMRPAGVQRALEQRRVPQLAEHAPRRAGRAPAWWTDDGHLRSMHRMSSDRRFHDSIGFRKVTRHECQIDFPYSTTLELAREPLMGKIRLGRHQAAARFFVESMHDTWT